MIFVFDFGFGERSPIVHAPIDRLQPAIDVTLLEKSEKRIGDGGLVMRVHREIRIIPVAQYSEPLEIAPMLIHVASSQFAAHRRNSAGETLSFLPAQLLFFHLCLDRQTVAIPARNVRAIETRPWSSTSPPCL